jgi:hypothetical protein
VFVVGHQSVLDLSHHPLTKYSKIGPKKPRFKVFVVVGVGVCGRSLICFGSIISSLDEIEQNWPEKTMFYGVCGRCFWCLWSKKPRHIIPKPNPAKFS